MVLNSWTLWRFWHELAGHAGPITGTMDSLLKLLDSYKPKSSRFGEKKSLTGIIKMDRPPSVFNRLELIQAQSPSWEGKARPREERTSSPPEITPDPPRWDHLLGDCGLDRRRTRLGGLPITGHDLVEPQHATVGCQLLRAGKGQEITGVQVYITLAL